MDRKLISRRIGSILDDISRLSNALYAMDMERGVAVGIITRIIRQNL